MVLALFKSRSVDEKRRMEAFMDALPYEYCGWNAQGVTVWSKHFPKLFNLATVQNIRDIQKALLPSDAAALEGMAWRLQKDNEPFTLNVRTHAEGKNITLHGVKGADLDGIETYDVLWAQDSTEEINNQDEINEQLTKLESDIGEYRAVLDIMPNAIWITNRDHTIEWCNQAYLKLTEQTREAARFHPAILKALPITKGEMSDTDLSKQSFEDHENKTLKTRLIVNGRRTLAEISILPDPKTRLVTHFMEDITEQENLRSDLDRYVSANTELMEQLSTAISIFGPQQNLEFYNPSFADLWGLEDTWLDARPSLGDILEKLRETRKLPEQADFRNYKKSWLDMFTTLLESEQAMMYLPDGSAIRTVSAPHPMGGLMITFEDVTSRLELESSYNTLVAVQKETLDNLTEGVVVYGSDARLQLCNPAYLKLWDLNPEDIDGNPHIHETIEKKKKFFRNGTIWEKYKSQLIGHAIERQENNSKIKRNDGVILELTSVPLPDGGVMVTYRDISDSMKIQQVLEEKNMALEEAEKLKTDFLAKVSYQLRTPLNAISGFSEILNAEYFGPVNEKQREYTDGILDATNRLSHLINDILDLSSIEAGYLRLDKSPVDLEEMLTDIHTLALDWAGMENIKTILDIASDINPKTLILDEKRVKQALVNIIRNAITHTPPQGTMTIKMFPCKGCICISVQDTGTGISEDDKANVFKPFNGDDDKASSGTGTGLGLTLAHNIIALHKGKINIENLQGTGTLVTINLPIKN
jgi:signal transduction histidine kinase